MQRDLNPTVLHFTGASLDVGGILSYVRSLSKFNGARDILIAQEGFEQTRGPRLKVFRLRPGDYASLISPAACWDCLKQVVWLRRKLARRPNWIFHGHSQGGLLIALVLVLLGYRNVVVTIHHNGSHRWFYSLAHRILRIRMIFLCPAMKRYYGLEGKSWRDCIPGSVVPQMRRTGQTKPPFFTAESTEILTLGCCGIVVEWKRWEIVLEAIGLLSEDLKKRVRFIHVGDPLALAISQDYSDKLRETVVRQGLESQVEWRGHQNDLNAFFQEIDLLVHPAENEPFGVSVLESLFAGTPVIASESVGASDLLKYPVNGMTFPTNDPRALAASLRRLLNGELAFPRVDRPSLRPLEPDYLGARWAEVYARLSEEPTSGETGG